MSALDLNRLNTTIRRCAATLLDASYTDHEPTETTDVWRTIAADAARDLTALITRLRAAEARTADLRAGLERVVKRCAEGGEQALAEAQCALDWDDDHAR